MMDVTLCFLLKDDEILLAMKKRKFGSGMLNGYGGKLEPGESVEQATVREVQEEGCVEVNISDLERVAILDFYFPSKPEWNQRSHVFIARSWKGVPQETEEMRPEWHKIAQLPYERCWSTDRYWLRPVLEGKKLLGAFTFADDNSSTKKYSIEFVDCF